MRINAASHEISKGTSEVGMRTLYQSCKTNSTNPRDGGKIDIWLRALDGTPNCYTSLCDVNTQLKHVRVWQMKRNKWNHLKRQDPGSPATTKALGIENHPPFIFELPFHRSHLETVTCTQKALKALRKDLSLRTCLTTRRDFKEKNQHQG